jgi:hypothetical protein
LPFLATAPEALLLKKAQAQHEQGFWPFGEVVLTGHLSNPPEALRELVAMREDFIGGLLP